MDLDILTLKPLTPLGENFAGAETNKSIGSSVVGFSRTGIGHEIASDCLKDLVRNFNGNIWNHNGPALLTRIISSWCQQELTENMTPDACFQFQVRPIDDFMPVHWFSNGMYFEPESASATMMLLESSYTAHFFSHMNKDRPIEKGSHVAYDLLAEKYCPRVYEVISGQF